MCWDPTKKGFKPQHEVAEAGPPKRPLFECRASAFGMCRSHDHTINSCKCQPCNFQTMPIWWIKIRQEGFWDPLGWVVPILEENWAIFQTAMGVASSPDLYIWHCLYLVFTEAVLVIFLLPTFASPLCNVRTVLIIADCGFRKGKPRALEIFLISHKRF